MTYLFSPLLNKTTNAYLLATVIDTMITSGNTIMNKNIMSCLHKDYLNNLITKERTQIWCMIFLKGKTHHLKCTVLWFYMHNVQPLPLSISRTFTPPREFLCDNRKWIISFQNCESLRCIPETYTIVHRLYFNKKRNPLSPNSPLLPSPGNH